jgi:hypothetical protein
VASVLLGRPSARSDEPIADHLSPLLYEPHTAAWLNGFLLPLSFGLDNPSRVGTIGGTSYMTIQRHVVADSSDLAGFAVKTGASP